MFDLTDRTALVTGAGRGVGLGIARVLIDAGAHVYVNDLEPDRAMTAARISANEHCAPFDVTDLEAVTTSLAAVAPVDVLVNNAGIPPSMRPLPFRQTTPDDWAPFLDVNIVGVLNCTRAVIDGMCSEATDESSRSHPAPAPTDNTSAYPSTAPARGRYLVHATPCARDRP